MTQNMYKTSESLSLAEIEFFQCDARIPKRRFSQCFLCRDLCYQFSKHALFLYSCNGLGRGEKEIRTCDCLRQAFERYSTFLRSPSRCVEFEKRKKIYKITKYRQHIVKYNSMKRYLTEQCLLKSRAKSINLVACDRTESQWL